jgi:hypothetical protein
MKVRKTRLEISSAELANELERVLAGGAVQAGLRLRSLADLSTLLKVDAGRVRIAVTELADRGILAKRHGSGTYIRRVPLANGHALAAPWFPDLRIEHLLADGDDEQSQRRPLRRHKQMHFQLWTDLFWLSQTQNDITAGAGDVLVPRGHVITPCGGTVASGVPLVRAAVAAKLAAAPADGYLVLDWLATAFSEEFAATGRPWLTFGFTGPIRHQPGMIMDCMEAAERGTRALLEGGCRRVALLGYFDNVRDCDFERFYYTHALRQAGADAYTCAKFISLEAMQVRRTLAEMLDGELSPDGLYVADDNLLPLVAAELTRRGLVPGRDLAVVTLWNEGMIFAGATDWSRMELSPRQFGQSLARNLVAATQSASARLTNYSVLAEWRPGATHILKPKTKEVPSQ